MGDRVGIPDAVGFIIFECVLKDCNPAPFNGRDLDLDLVGVPEEVAC